MFIILKAVNNNYGDLMKKRLNIIGAIIILSLFALTLRIAYIDFFKTSSVAVTNGTKEEIYGSDRGLIFDRNMQKLVETQNVKVHTQISSDFKFVISQRYSDNQLAEHIIGYLDIDNEGISGIEKDYNNFLKNIKNNLKIKYYTDAKGRILKGKGIKIDQSEKCTDTGIVLNIDKNIQFFSQSCGAKLKKGCIIVMDSKNGDVISLASFPSFNPNCINKYINDNNYPLLNRALQNYNVGSVFKVVVCMAALENDISENYVYDCKGHINCGGLRFNCHNLKGHGKLDMKGALSVSCNTYFINLAQKVGAEKIIQIARRLGLDKSLYLSESIISAQGHLPNKYNLSSPAALANFSFGQGELLETPLHMAIVYSTIANGGYLTKPSIVKSIIFNGKNKEISVPEKRKRVISETSAQKINSFLECTVLNGTGKNANVKNCVTAGKTATAQTGKYDNGKEKLISYFIGYITTKNDNKYTVLVMKENGVSGSSDCAPVFKKIGEYIVKNEG